MEDKIDIRFDGFTNEPGIIRMPYEPADDNPTTILLTVEMVAPEPVAVTNPLDELADMYDQLEARRLAYEAERERIIAPVKAELAALTAQYDADAVGIQYGIDSLVDQIKSDVIAVGATVPGARMIAVYSAGRTSWDSKALAGYAAAHPEILPFKNVSAPSVTIRRK